MGGGGGGAECPPKRKTIPVDSRMSFCESFVPVVSPSKWVIMYSAWMIRKARWGRSVKSRPPPAVHAKAVSEGSTVQPPAAQPDEIVTWLAWIAPKSAWAKG